MLHILLVFSPLVGALIAGLFGRMIGDRAAQIVTCTFMGIAALCAVIGLFSYVGAPGFKVPIATWIGVSPTAPNR